MTAQEIIGMADSLVVVSDGAYRWLGDRAEVYAWIDSHGHRRGYDYARNLPNTVTLTADEYQEMCDETTCYADTSGSYGPGEMRAYDLIARIDAPVLHVL